MEQHGAIYRLATVLGMLSINAFVNGKKQGFLKRFLQITKVHQSAGSIMADAAYDSDKLREQIVSLDGTACIKPRRNRNVLIPFDKERHLVECFFQKLKRYRRIATRYDKLAKRSLAFIHLACILIWLL